MKDKILDIMNSKNFKPMDIDKIYNELNLSSSKEFTELAKTLNSLVDEKSKSNEEFLTGRTETFKTVNFKGSEDLIGQIVDVEITDVGTFSLNGKLKWKI